MFFNAIYVLPSLCLLRLYLVIYLPFSHFFFNFKFFFYRLLYVIPPLSPPHVGFHSSSSGRNGNIMHSNEIKKSKNESNKNLNLHINAQTHANTNNTTNRNVIPNSEYEKSIKDNRNLSLNSSSGNYSPRNIGNNHINTNINSSNYSNTDSKYMDNKHDKNDGRSDRFFSVKASHPPWRSGKW